MKTLFAVNAVSCILEAVSVITNQICGMGRETQMDEYRRRTLDWGLGGIGNVLDGIGKGAAGEGLRGKTRKEVKGMTL